MNEKKWWMILFAAAVIAVVSPLMLGLAQGDDVRSTGDYVLCSGGSCSSCADCSTPGDCVGVACAECSRGCGCSCAEGTCEAAKCGTSCTGRACSGCTGGCCADGACSMDRPCDGSDCNAVGLAS